jgi:hypothetical protein
MQHKRKHQRITDGAELLRRESACILYESRAVLEDLTRSEPEELLKSIVQRLEPFFSFHVLINGEPACLIDDRVIEDRLRNLNKAFGVDLSRPFCMTENWAELETAMIQWDALFPTAEVLFRVGECPEWAGEIDQDRIAALSGDAPSLRDIAADAIEGAFSSVARHYHLTSGDVSPTDSVRMSKLIGNLAGLLQNYYQLNAIRKGATHGKVSSD